jgi:hypothetical protein
VVAGTSLIASIIVVFVQKLVFVTRMKSIQNTGNELKCAVRPARCRSSAATLAAWQGARRFTYDVRASRASYFCWLECLASGTADRTQSDRARLTMLVAEGVRHGYIFDRADLTCGTQTQHLASSAPEGARLKDSAQERHNVTCSPVSREV